MKITGLARWGLTHQVFKSALAASAAYAVCARLLDHRFPVFGPMAALLTIQINVFNSFSRGVQRVVAILVGLGVAMFAFHFTGANWWIIFIVVILTLMVGTRMGLGVAAINQVPMSALLILAAKAYVPTYALDRIVNTFVGTLIALLINVLLWPPNSLPQARKSVQQLGDDAIQLLRESAEVLRNPARSEGGLHLIAQARQLDKQVGLTINAVQAAQQSLRMNPRIKALGPVVHEYRDRTGMLERAAVQIRGIAKSVSELHEECAALPDGDGMARYLGLAAEQLKAWQDAAPTRDIQDQAESLFDHISRTSLTSLRELPHVWPRYGSVLADASHLIQQLADASSSAPAHQVHV